MDCTFYLCEKYYKSVFNIEPLIFKQIANLGYFLSLRFSLEAMIVRQDQTVKKLRIYVQSPHLIGLEKLIPLIFKKDVEFILT